MYCISVPFGFSHPFHPTSPPPCLRSSASSCLRDSFYRSYRHRPSTYCTSLALQNICGLRRYALLWLYNRMELWKGLCQHFYAKIYSRFAKKLQHPKPAKPQYAPHPWVVPAYVQHIKMATVDESKKLDSKGIRYVQYIVGSLLYQ